MATVNIYDMADTWNDGGTTFTAIKMDVTDTASASGSLLMDLLVDSSTLFSVSAAGNISLGADVAAPGTRTLSMPSVTGVPDTAGANFTIQGSQSTGDQPGGSILFQVSPAGVISGTGQNGLQTALTIGSNKQVQFEQYIVSNAGGVSLGEVGLWQRTNGHLTLRNTSILGWSGGTNVNADQPGDTRLYRDGIGQLALRNGANAQEFNIYNTYTDASNYERGFMKWNSNVLEIGTEAAGSGANRNLYFKVPAGSEIRLVNGTTTLFRIDDTKLFPSTDNARDLGTASLRFKSIYAGTSITPSAAVAVSALPTPSLGMIAQVNDATALSIGSTVTGGGAAAALVWYNGTNWTVIGV